MGNQLFREALPEGMETIVLNRPKIQQNKLL